VAFIRKSLSLTQNHLVDYVDQVSSFTNCFKSYTFMTVLRNILEENRRKCSEDDGRMGNR
jgi:hypothetical protein